MASATFQRLQEANALPSPTGVALELLRLASDPEATLEAVGTVVESDPAFAGRLLKLANSPFAGVPRRVASVSLAVRLLGLRTVKNLALGLSLVSSNRHGQCRSFAYEAFWSRSLARAVAAREIAARQKDFPVDEAFTTGLLAEIGQLALATAYPVELARILDSTDAHDELALLRAERAAFGADHFELSAEIMSGWYLQDLFGEAVKAQSSAHCPLPGDSSRPAQLARTVHLAGLMATVLSDPDAPPEAPARVVAEAAEIGMSEDAARLTFDGAAAHWREAGMIFAISTRELASFDELRSRAESANLHPDSGPTGDETSGAVTAQPGGLRILIVDDDEDALHLLERQLSQAGYRVLVARSGTEALEIDRAHAPPMIITDWMMPGIDGIELCRRLRHHDHAGFVYIIMVTAGLEANLAVEALEAGADDFLSKPCNHQELLARVRAGERIVSLEARVAERSREIALFNTRLTAANEQLQVVATTDVLTGLPNRREAMARLAEHWSLVTRYGGPLSCIVADIDHFKRFNDRHGHAVGDAVLKATAGVLVKARRAGEVVYRIGGEEFLIICPRATSDAAEVAAERARAAVAACTVESAGATLSVTLSLGVAERTSAMRDAGDLLHAADEAMYAAKNAGRNRVCVAGAADEVHLRADGDPSSRGPCATPAASAATDALLLELAMDLLAADDAAAVYARVVSSATQLAHCRRAVLFIPDRAGRNLVVGHAAGLEPAEAASLHIAIGDGLIGRVFSSGLPLVLNRPEDEAPAAGEAASLRPPMICRPLPAGNHIVGVLQLSDPQESRTFLPPELDAIELLARMAGPALVRSPARMPA